jgi:hypothetical protein
MTPEELKALQEKVGKADADALQYKKRWLLTKKKQSNLLMKQSIKESITKETFEEFQDTTKASTEALDSN